MVGSKHGKRVWEQRTDELERFHAPLAGIIFYICGSGPVRRELAAPAPKPPKSIRQNREKQMKVISLALMDLFDQVARRLRAAWSTLVEPRPDHHME